MTPEEAGSNIDKQTSHDSKQCIILFNGMISSFTVYHEWLQPSSNSSYNHNKVDKESKIHRECNDNGSQQSQQQSSQIQSLPVSLKTQKYFTPPSIVTSRQLHQTQQIILPEVKSNYKLYKDRTKGN